MAAPMVQCMKNFFFELNRRYSFVCCRCVNRLSRFVTHATLASVVSLNVNDDIHHLIKTHNPANLTQTSLIKNASSVAVDASSAVLSQVVASLIDTEKEYKEAVEALSELLEFQLEIVGDGGQQEEELWQLILEARHRLAIVENTQKDLAMLFASVEKLMDASGEVAFFAGAEYAVTCTGERVHSAQTYIAQVKEQSKMAEEALHQLEVKVIEATARRAEEEKLIAEMNQKEDESEAEKDSEDKENEDSS